MEEGTVEETQLEGEQANVSRLDFRTSKVKRCLKHFFGRVVETNHPFQGHALVQKNLWK